MTKEGTIQSFKASSWCFACTLKPLANKNHKFSQQKLLNNKNEGKCLQPKQCKSLLFSGKIPRKFAIDSCIKFHSPSQKKRGSQFKFFPCRLTGHPPLISILSKSSASRAPLAMRIRIRRCPRPFFSVEMTGRSFGSWLTPLKINILHIIPCRFGFKSFSFLFMGDGCRFQPLIFQGLKASCLLICSKYSYLKRFDVLKEMVMNSYLCPKILEYLNLRWFGSLFFLTDQNVYTKNLTPAS